jgi:hypothetical protein
VSSVVVFIVGGFTYEEAAAVQAINATLGLQVTDHRLLTIRVETKIFENFCENENV